MCRDAARSVNPSVHPLQWRHCEIGELQVDCSCADIRYLVAAGLAVNAHGLLRLTYAKVLVKPLYGTIEVRFVSIPTLIAMKEAAGREQDRIDVEHLRMRLDDDAGQ
jgi:hypothetical protein